MIKTIDPKGCTYNYCEMILVLQPVPDYTTLDAATDAPTDAPVDASHRLLLVQMRHQATSTSATR